MYIHIYIYIYKQASHYVTLHVITLCYVAYTHTHAGIHIHMDIHTHTCDMCIHSTLKTYVQVGTNTIYIDIQDTNY